MTRIEVDNSSHGWVAVKIDGVHLKDKYGWYRRFKTPEAAIKAAEKVAKAKAARHQ